MRPIKKRGRSKSRDASRNKSKKSDRLLYKSQESQTSSYVSEDVMVQRLSQSKVVPSKSMKELEGLERQTEELQYKSAAYYMDGSHLKSRLETSLGSKKSRSKSR